MFEHIAPKLHQLQSQLSPSTTLIAVSKTQPVAAIEAAYRAGLRHFGENYVQEAIGKIEAFEVAHPQHEAQWHFIGPIQSNKTRDIAQYFDWVHSVDRLKIAQRLSEQHPHSKPALNICLQVNISLEPNKSGVLPNEALTLAQAIVGLPQLRLRGLMAIPAPINPHADVAQQRAPFFALATLHNQIKAALPDTMRAEFDTLSMGMSDDFVHAQAEGSTMVRIGSAIFGTRVSPK